MGNGAFGDLDGPILTHRKRKPAKGQDRANSFASQVFQLKTERDFLKKAKKADRERHLDLVDQHENQLEVARTRLVNAVKHRNMDIPLVFKASVGVVVVWRANDYKTLHVEHIEFEQGRGFKD